MPNFVFIGYPAYGDFLSSNGLLRYLLSFFDNVIYYVHNEHIEYLKVLFNDIIEKILFLNEDSLKTYRPTAQIRYIQN